MQSSLRTLGRPQAGGSSFGQVAQLVEHSAENRGVAGSIPALPIPRTIVRIEADKASFAKLGDLMDRWGMTQVTIVSRLVEYVAGLDDETRAAILGQFDRDAALLILRRMEATRQSP
jgi:hypothetical protein